MRRARVLRRGLGQREHRDTDVGRETVAQSPHAKWYNNVMRTTIDSAGRIVIPKATRSRLGLEAGKVVEIRERDGLLEIEPVATVMALEKRHGGLVAVPEERLPPLTDAMVRATLEGTRR